ncbi:sugar transferase [Primorskyibacter sp. S87]|uniref:sugar transferase n=1 Tax=Primorskyibacter sp. S87 TaxID=3415126 RepID=UPI003C7A9144
MTHFDLFETRAEITVASRRGLYTRVGKRALDLSLSLLLLPILLPLIVLGWVATRLQGGPGFYAHKRVGRHGRSFSCYKIRTMRVDGDTILRNHLDRDPGAAREWAKNRKLRDDPRVTSLGRFLRRTSLDELPQIFNVLRGDMSLVGPRPITREELVYYDPVPATYLCQKPGVTGLWQVRGRQDGCFRNRVQLDLNYLRQVSLATDLGLIGRTALTVLFPSGC